MSVVAKIAVASLPFWGVLCALLTWGSPVRFSGDIIYRVLWGTLALPLLAVAPRLRSVVLFGLASYLLWPLLSQYSYPVLAIALWVLGVSLWLRRSGLRWVRWCQMAIVVVTPALAYSQGAGLFALMLGFGMAAVLPGFYFAKAIANDAAFVLAWIISLASIHYTYGVTPLWPWSLAAISVAVVLPSLVNVALSMRHARSFKLNAPIQSKF